MFWRERGWKEDEEAVEAREGVCNITDMLTNALGDEFAEAGKSPKRAPMVD